MSQEQHPPEQDSPPPRRFPEEFLQAFRTAVQNLGWHIVGWRTERVNLVDSDGEEQSIGLGNLFRRAQQVEPTEWVELITGFLQRVDVRQFDDLKEIDLLDVAHRLLVRIGQPFGPLRQGPSVWSAPLDETGLTINLVVDYPQAMAFVNVDQLEKSGEPGEFWLEQALDNLEARSDAEDFQRINDEMGMLVYQTGDSYESSRALILDRLLEPAPGGFLVAIPNRDLLIVLPIDLQAIPHCHLMKVLSTKYHETAPYAISPEVFWVHEGVWRLFPIELGEKDINVIPPPEFVEVLNQLGANLDEDDPDETA